MSMINVRKIFADQPARPELKNEALVINDQTHLDVYKGLDGRFPKNRPLLFVTRPLFSDTLSFSLFSLSLNRALEVSLVKANRNCL